MLKTIGLLCTSAIFVFVYVALNFFLAQKLIQKSSTIRESYEKKVQTLTNSLAFPSIIYYVILLSVVTYWAKSELRTSEDIIWSAALLMVLGLFPLLVFGWVIWRFEVIRDWLDWRINQIAVVIFFAVLTWFSRTQAAGVLNSVFPVDPSNFSYALIAGTFLITIGFLSLLVILAALCIEFVALVVFFELPKKLTFQGAFYALAPLSFFIFVYTSSNALAALGLSPFGKLLIIRIAYDSDFNENHLCKGTKKGDRVLFIGSTQQRVLVALSPDLQVKAPHKLSKKDAEKWYPADFRVLNCFPS